MSTEYDLIIIGAGPAGIFCAHRVITRDPSKRVLVLERGHALEHRVCPKRTTHICAHCNPCSITAGFAGAGAFSDGKLSLSPSVGGYLPEILGTETAADYIAQSDDLYLSFGADPHVYGAEHGDGYRHIHDAAKTAGLELVDCPIRHIGTEKGFDLYLRLENHLRACGAHFAFDTPVNDILIGESGVSGVRCVDGREFKASSVVAAVGRAGASWLAALCEQHNIPTQVGTVDVGVRVETSDMVMKELNENFYEAKLLYRTPTYGDKVRTFCTNPSGEVTNEVYDDGLCTVNGHAYKDEGRRTENTNFALLVSQRFTKPFHTPLEYGRAVARLANMLCDGSVMIQTLGDIRRGRRSTAERIEDNPLRPTMTDAVAGDLSLALPHRIMVDVLEMLDALDRIAPGIASNETLLYGVEVKFYSNSVVVSPKFETSISGFYAIGDGAGITHGLQQASANGLALADMLVEDSAHTQDAPTR